MEKIHRYLMMLFAFIFFLKAIQGLIWRIPMPISCGGSVCRIRRSIYVLLGDVAGSYFVSCLYFLVGFFVFYFALKSLCKIYKLEKKRSSHED